MGFFLFITSRKKVIKPNSLQRKNKISLNEADARFMVSSGNHDNIMSILFILSNSYVIGMDSIL